MIESQKAVRQLRNILLGAKFKCPDCNEAEFAYEKREEHLRFCQSFKMKCPLENCSASGFLAKDLTYHVNGHCSSDELTCPLCNESIYKLYSNGSMDKEHLNRSRGHNCVRDLKYDLEQVRNVRSELYKKVDSLG